MHARIQEMERLENMRDSGDINRLTKKEGLLIEREIIRLNTRLEGVRSMKRLPDLVFVVDVSREYAAVHEANLLNIPIVALVDTNCNPQNIDYVIPSNDDAIRAIKLLVSKIADALIEGKSMRKDDALAEGEEEAVTIPVSAVAKRPARNIDVDVDETDEALLGKATLAKLAKTDDVKTQKGQPKPVAKENEIPTDTVEGEVLSEDETLPETPDEK
jgi:small subunit ribosomal protein S2